MDRNADACGMSVSGLYKHFPGKEEIKKSGVRVKDINQSEFHLIVTACIEALFQTVIHGFSREEAVHFAGTLESFYGPAWKEFFGL